MQFPVMLAGAIVCSVGTGLLINIDVTTPTVVWVVFMVIAGFGDGMCTNMPYSAIQAILDECDNPQCLLRRVSADC
jgi:hypothetical protein